MSRQWSDISEGSLFVYASVNGENERHIPSSCHLTILTGARHRTVSISTGTTALSSTTSHPPVSRDEDISANGFRVSKPVNEPTSLKGACSTEASSIWSGVRLDSDIDRDQFLRLIKPLADVVLPTDVNRIYSLFADLYKLPTRVPLDDALALVAIALQKVTFEASADI